MAAVLKESKNHANLCQPQRLCIVHSMHLDHSVYTHMTEDINVTIKVSGRPSQLITFAYKSLLLLPD